MQKKYVESLNEFTNAILLAPEGWPEKPKLYCNRAAAYMMLNRCVRHRGSQSWAGPGVRSDNSLVVAVMDP